MDQLTRDVAREPGAVRAPQSFSFDDVEFDPGKAELRRAGKPCTLPALSLALLHYLIRERDRVVTRDELLAEVWHGVTVSEGALRQAIWELRQTLDDSAEQQRYIRTVRGRGYRFVGAFNAGTELARGCPVRC